MSKSTRYLFIRTRIGTIKFDRVRQLLFINSFGLFKLRLVAVEIVREFFKPKERLN